MKTVWKIGFVLSILVGVAFNWIPSLASFGPEGVSKSQAAPAQAAGKSLFLPVVNASFPYQSMFGAEVPSISGYALRKLSVEAKGTWIRKNGLSWAAMEPAPGERNWSAVSSLEGELKLAYLAGVSVVLVVRDTPEWAQETPGSACGPIKPEDYEAFGRFLYDAVARYSIPPYNVKYWEIYNEPDIQVTIGNQTNGCWGKEDDNRANYGGESYGEMLNVIYPYVKSANPQAQVLVGGLLLDCDPNSVCTNSRAPHFLTGILNTGAGNSFDGISFHAYDYLSGDGKGYNNANWGSAWNNGGPSLYAKINYIRTLLAAQGVSGKFLMNTEAAILKDGTCDDACEDVKAYYVTQEYAASFITGVRATLWYNSGNWRNADMFMRDGTPLPAYNAFQFASIQFLDASFSQELSFGAEVKALEFNRKIGRLDVFWSVSQNPDSVQPITLPAIPAKVWIWNDSTNLYEAGVPAANLSVGRAPVYVEWAP